MLASVVQVWAQNGPEDFLNSVYRLPEGVGENGIETAISKISQDSPLRAVHLFEKMTLPESRKTVALSIMQNWSAHDFEASLQWVLTNELLVEFRHELLGNLVISMSPDDMERSLNAAIDQPIEETGVGLEYAVIYAMSMLDLDKAIESLDRVRTGKTSSYTVGVVASRLASSDRIEEAMDLIKKYPDLDLGTVFQRMALGLLGGQSRILFGVLDQIPSKEHRSNTAAALLYYDSYEQALTRSQTEQLKTFLTEIDASKIEDGQKVVLDLDRNLMNW